jgi:nicotinamidase-related amidase
MSQTTHRTRNQAALLIVDVQVGVVKEAWDAPRIIGNVSHAVERARAQGVPVIWVQHSDEELVHGSDAWQWAVPLQPREGELRIDKHFNSSFEETPLQDELTKLGVTHIVLAGALTNWCIRATAYGALERGYDLTLIKDAHTTKDIDLGDDKKIEAANLIIDLNIAMTWLSYPGRVNGTATAEAVDFAKPGGTR